ncbi:MAG TPA: peptidylprolyl isomerase [Burkholderiales bacterium]|jgi:peptidyl-prolyl cis-trans isomerase SurA|nr:peptidylprolyl isomerase [Burkholderiales bacterium]
MRLIAFAVLLVASLEVRAQNAPLAAQPVLLDRVVAVVNSEVVTKLELEEQVKMAAMQLRRQGAPLPSDDVLERQVLERMVTSRVLAQAARESGLRVDDTQLQRALQRIAEDSKLTLDGFREAIENDGVDFSRFREEIRNEILISRLKEREVDSRIVITEAEIDSYLRNQAAQGDRDDEYNLAHILILVPEEATPEQIQAKKAVAERALAQLKGGTDFRQVSASFSDAQNALEGGVLGWRPAGRLPQLFVDAVRSLNVGDVSPILRSSNGFHILKLLDKRGNRSPVIVQQTHVRHILVRSNEVVSEAEARQRLADLRERVVLGNADFGELARLHSEDASAVRGGDLGWVSPGETVPDFERAMDALQVNEISEPVRSPFGWHLIQVLGRRTEDLSGERQRMAARQAIRQRKAEEAYQEWVRLQRDRAYVEYRIEERQ